MLAEDQRLDLRRRQAVSGAISDRKRAVSNCVPRPIIFVGS